MARYLSQRENDADKVAGKRYASKGNNYLQQVLFDLVQTDTIKNSLILGHHLLSQIRPVHHLHCQHTEQAAFAVLKSPAIPSVLVETAFITNHDEERLLTSPRSAPPSPKRLPVASCATCTTLKPICGADHHKAGGQPMPRHADAGRHRLSCTALT